MKPDSTGIYSFSIVGTAQTSVYLDNHPTPLFEIDNQGSYYHTVVMKLDASYHYLEAHVVAEIDEHFTLYGATRNPSGIPYVLSRSKLFLPPTTPHIDPLPQSASAWNGRWEGHVSVWPQMPTTFQLSCDKCEGSVNAAGDVTVLVNDACSVSVGVETIEGITTLSNVTLTNQDMISGFMVSLYVLRFSDDKLFCRKSLSSLSELDRFFG